MQPEGVLAGDHPQRGDPDHHAPRADPPQGLRAQGHQGQQLHERLRRGAQDRIRHRLWPRQALQGPQDRPAYRHQGRQEPRRDRPLRQHRVARGVLAVQEGRPGVAGVPAAVLLDREAALAGDPDPQQIRKVRLDRPPQEDGADRPPAEALRGRRGCALPLLPVREGSEVRGGAQLRLPEEALQGGDDQEEGGARSPRLVTIATNLFQPS